ncbi:MAG: hypothetical protein ACYC4D_05295 [Thermoleophilia bacterium]
MSDKNRNNCDAWSFRSTFIHLSRKDDYLARACYLCRLYRSCFDHPKRGTQGDDGTGRGGGRAHFANL